jgi:hypothetical protein
MNQGNGCQAFSRLIAVVGIMRSRRKDAQMMLPFWKSVSAGRSSRWWHIRSAVAGAGEVAADLRGTLSAKHPSPLAKHSRFIRHRERDIDYG